jgi:Cd2+/Zn2+-exporting ATPase
MNPVELPMAPTAPETAETAEPVEELAGDRRFRVDGMDCAACARTIEKRVGALPGVTSATVSFGAGTMAVAGGAEDRVILAEVTSAGYRAHRAGERLASPRAPFWRRDVRALSTTVSVAILLVAVVCSLASAPRAVAEPLYLVSMVVGGWPIARSAVGALRTRALDMNVLMTLAALGAVGIGAYAEAAWVLVLFAIGTGLESLALDRTRSSMQSLMELAPSEVRVLSDGEERLLEVDQVFQGMAFVVRPGERLALDGEVVSGASRVDQSPITGESVPVDKAAGDEVFAGTLNTNGTLTVRVTRAASQSTLSRVAQLVEDAQGSKAPSERFIDRFARLYTPAVFVVAVALATVPLLFGGDFDTWSYRALALLIVACPCSLVISVPVAVVSAVGGAARQGILIKGGQALEDLARVRAVALDKTGTLTVGLPKVESVVTLGAVDEERALALAAAVEAGSEHPLAAAVRRAARERGVDQLAAEDFQASPGRGAEATVDGARLWVGGPRLAVDRTGAVPDGVDRLQDAGQTAIVLGEGDRALAVFGLADMIRPEATTVTGALRAAGVDQITMLTGDAEPVARAVAGRARVDHVRAGLLPEDKLAAIEDMQRRSVVAMVGDGVNDAPALAAATVGVAMGAAGSDVALQNADVALMADRLDRLPTAITLARRARSIMRFNVVASLVVKGLFVLLAPFGLVTLVVAVAADMGMSLLVTLNALRLVRADEHAVRRRGADEPCGEACCST